MEPPDFPQVLAAAQLGAAWAYRVLFDALAPPVAAYYRARGLGDVDDLGSEVFLSVFSGLGGFSGGEDEFRAWVFTIAHRRYVDHIRRRARAPVSVSYDHAMDSRADISAEDAALSCIADRDLQAVLADLPPDQRDVLALRVVSDLSIEQTAALLGKTQGAVKALQHRALASLRRKFSAEGVSP